MKIFSYIISSNQRNMETWTITFSESVENHTGMQIIGSKCDHGFSRGDIDLAKQYFESKGIETEMIDLRSGIESVQGLNINDFVPEDKIPILFIARGGAKAIVDTDDEYNKFIEDIKSSKDIVDKKAFMKGRVVNKIARYNLCYSDEPQEPDYEKR